MGKALSSLPERGVGALSNAFTFNHERALFQAVTYQLRPDGTQHSEQHQ